MHDIKSLLMMIVYMSSTRDNVVGICLIAWARRSRGPLNDEAPGTGHTLPLCPPLPRPSVQGAPCQQITAPTSQRQPDTTGEDGMQNVHFLWTLLVHSQIVHKLCAGFSLNSLRFSQFHPLLFQTEKDHKQLLHKSRLIRFAFFAIFV